jgi:PEP-CTERM motif
MHTRTTWFLLALAALVMGLASHACAGLVVANVEHDYPIGTTTASIPIFITGDASDVVDVMNLNVEIANLGFDAHFENFPAGPGPKITFDGNTSPYQATAGGDFAGNFMSATPHAFVVEHGDDSWNFDEGESLTEPGLNIPAITDGGGGPGLLVTVLIDFTGFNTSPGTWRIIMDGQNANGATNFTKVLPDNNLQAVPVDLNQANFLVKITPEPSSVALAVVGFAGLAAWGWRRRRA